MNLLGESNGHERSRGPSIHLCIANYWGIVLNEHHQSMNMLMHRLGNLRRHVHLTQPRHTIASTARQLCAQEVLNDEECEYCCFIDDDMVFTPEQFLALEQEFVENDLDFLSALAFANSYPTKPCIFGRVDGVDEGAETPWWQLVTDFPGNKGGVDPEPKRFRIYASGFGMVFMSRRMLDAMRRNEDGEIIQDYQHFVLLDAMCPNEDIAFCVKANRQGFKLYCDSRVSIGHIAKFRPVISQESYEAQGMATQYNQELVDIAIDPESGCVLLKDAPEPKPIQEETVAV